MTELPTPQQPRRTRYEAPAIVGRQSTVRRLHDARSDASAAPGVPRPTSTPPTRNSVARVIGAAFGMALVSLLVVGSFADALHDPAPRGLPVAAVGPAAAVRQVEGALAAHAPGAFTLHVYKTQGTAGAAVLDRSVDAAIYLGPGEPRLVVAGAEGPFTTNAITSAFGAMASALGQHLLVQDVRPLPSGDPYGTSQLYLVLGLALPSIGFGIALSVLGHQLNPVVQLCALGLFALLAGIAATWTVDGLVGALVGAPFALFGLATLTACAVSTTCAAGARSVGIPLAALLALLIVPVGIPAAGGPFGPAFVTSWYAHLGSALPAGAAMSAVRSAVYFNGNGLGSPLLVLALWAAVALVVLCLPPLRLVSAHRRPAGEPVAQVPLTSTLPKAASDWI